MPKAEKLRKLERGEKVRPPKKWWSRMRRRIGQMQKYKEFGAARKSRIVAGIWHGYSVATQKRLVRRYG